MKFFTVAQDIKDFAALPSKERDALVKRLLCAHAVLTAPRGTKGTAARTVAEAHGVHTATVEAWAYRLKRNGWKALIDHRALPRPVGTRR